MNTKIINLNNPLVRWMALAFAVLALAIPRTWAASQKAPTPRPPTIYSFNVAAEATINLGTKTSLNWQASNDATEVTLSPGFGAVPIMGSVEIAPTETTTYVLTARNAGGAVTKSKVITVIVPPVIQSFTVLPESITAGQSAKLTWSAPGATWYYVEADTDVDPGQLFTTTATVKPKTTVTYKLTANNSAGSTTKTLTLPVAPTIPKPTINSFTAQPATIAQGDATTLSWAVNGATTVSISPGVGEVKGTSVSVSPSATTTYTLTATNNTGSVTRTTKVTVTATPPPAPVITSFTAAPSTITLGDSATLNWAVTGATSLSISPDIGAVTGTSLNVKPAATTTYVLSATGPGGTVTKSVPVTVNVPPPAPVIASFAANPATIEAGQSTTLSWSVSGATSLSISGVGNVTGTSVVVTPSSSTTYVLSATGPGGTVTKNVDVTVNPPAPMPTIASFAPSSSTITAGNPVTLNWSVSGATSLSISPGVGTVTGASLTLTPTATTTYTLTATNASGSVTKSATVTVLVAVPAPLISAFAAQPDTIPQGGSSTLTWSVTGATSLSISANLGQSPGTVTGTSAVVRPVATTSYTLTATNEGGSVTKSVTVVVNDPLPVVRSFGSSPRDINAGESTTLFWDVVGAVSFSITADRGVSPGPVTGTTLVVTPETTTLYTLRATNASGGTTISVAQVTVIPAPPAPVPVIASFAASPDEISIGASTTLTWSVSAADGITITADQGANPGVVTGTSLVVSPAVTTRYTLKATNTFGNSTKTAQVTVVGPKPPKIGSFLATPAFITAGNTSKLSWTVSGANSLSISADVGPSPGAVTGTELVVAPTQTTTYTLTAVNDIGQTTAIAPVTIFTAGGGGVTHPRIWITPAQVPVLAQRALAGDAAWIKLRNECDQYATMRVAFPDEDPSSNTINGGYQYNDYLLPSQTLALGYLVAKNFDSVRAARYLAKEKELLLALSDPVHHGRESTDSGYSIRAYVPALALGYDWIYETLNDAEKAQIFTEINRWVKWFDDHGFGRNFPQGNYFAGYYCAKALGALATEGDNPNATAMWNDWLNRIHYGMVQPYHQLWLTGGGAPDGWNYGPFETINMLRPIAAALTAKGLDLIHDPVKPIAYFDGHARWMTQFTWPDMKTVSDRGFVYEGNNPTATDADWATQYNGLLHIANGDNAAIMQQYALDIRALRGTNGLDGWAEFLLHPAGAPTASYRIPLSYRTVGDGQVAMRSSWDSNAVWGTFQSGPLTNFPDSAEELFDQGSLAIQRGDVQFVVNPWGALMRHTPGTDDGNPVFNFVFNEVFQDQTDGVHAGRRIFNTYTAFRAAGYWGQIGDGPGARTTLSRFEEGGSYVLMRGTGLEDQYWAPHPISGWTRNVVYVRPQLFVVYDRTTLNTPSADNWMPWHVAANPTESTDAAPGTRRFDVVDTRAAFGGNLFRGRVTTILPAGHTVTKVNLGNFNKVYRLEVRSAAPAAASSWLAVLDASASAATAKSAAPLTAEAGNVLAGAVEGTLISGADGSGVAVLFSKTGSAVTGPISLSLPIAATQCIVTDLQPGAGYTVSALISGSSLVVQVTAGGSLTATAQGTLAFNVSATGVVTAP